MIQTIEYTWSVRASCQSALFKLKCFLAVIMIETVISVANVLVDLVIGILPQQIFDEGFVSCTGQ